MKKLHLFFILNCFNSFGQKNAVVAGTTIENNTGSISFTIGQIDYLQSQGVQQPYLEIDLIEDNEKTMEVMIFPNPTANDISLQISNYEEGVFSFDLYDINNKLIDSKNIESPLINYSLEEQANAVYFLTIKQNNTPVKQFKIVKTN